MTLEQIQAYGALLGAAMAIGDAIYDGVRQLVGVELSEDELRQVLAQWDENAARARRNTGLPPEVPPAA